MNVTVAVTLLLIALLALVAGMRLRRRTGLPWAPVRYQDTYGRELEGPLLARRLGLVGKPDYLLDLRGRTVPVEVKPGRRSPRPYDSDLMQLAAYCVLVEETCDQAPPYGLLRYAEHTFRLDYTPQVREEVLALVAEMQASLDQPACDRSHDDAARCRGCGFFMVCDQALEQE
jgi:CRISPR-associated exonuclease Cas4